MIHQLKSRVSALSVATVMTIGMATTIVTSQPVLAESSNLISNSGFESPSNLTGWNNSNSNLQLSTTVAHSGSQSAYATVTTGLSVSTQVLNDSPNILDSPSGVDWIHYSIWVKGVSGGIVTLTNGSGFSYPVTLTDSNWTKVDAAYDVTMQASQSGHNEYFVNYRQPDTNQSGTIYMDDASFTTGTDSASCGDPVFNCGFEYPYGLDGWNTVGSDNTSNVSLTTTADAHDGSAAALLTRTASTSGTISLNDSPDYIYNNAIAIYGKTSCTATAWVKSSSTSGNVKISLTQYGTGGSGQVVTTVTPSTSWQQISVTIANGNNGGLDWKIYQTSVPQNGTLTIDTANETCN